MGAKSTAGQSAFGITDSFDATISESSGKYSQDLNEQQKQFIA